MPYTTIEMLLIQNKRICFKHYILKFIHTYMGMTLRENQRDYYFKKLDEHFVGLKQKYLKCYGARYNCKAINYKKLYKVFMEECKKYGLLYKMSDIIKAYKKNASIHEQLTLF